MSSVAKSGTLRRWVTSERERYLSSISFLKDVPLKVGALILPAAFVAASGSRVPRSMSRITRSISTITQSSVARTVAARGWKVRQVISPKISPGPSHASGMERGRSIEASMGMNPCSATSCESPRTSELLMVLKKEKNPRGFVRTWAIGLLM